MSPSWQQTDSDTELSPPTDGGKLITGRPQASYFPPKVSSRATACDPCSTPVSHSSLVLMAQDDSCKPKPRMCVPEYRYQIRTEEPAYIHTHQSTSEHIQTSTDTSEGIPVPVPPRRFSGERGGCGFPAHTPNSRPAEHGSSHPNSGMPSPNHSQETVLMQKHEVFYIPSALGSAAILHMGVDDWEPWVQNLDSFYRVTTKPTHHKPIIS